MALKARALRREDLGSLAMFLAVTEEQSFTRAAAKLGISQSALSHSMSRLEARLGLRLLTRTTRSVAPTEAGQGLVDTLRPALDEIDNKLALLTEMRERPAGNIRITTSEHAARSVLWPAVDRLTSENPDIHVELNIESSLTDIVAGRFDAGVRLGERLEQDMIAVPIGPRLRMATVAAPAYFAKHREPQTPNDLTGHACINLRMMTGGIYAWEFEKNGRELKVKVQGQIVLNNVDLIVAAAVAGRGIAHLIEDRVASLLAEGKLVRVLDDWCAPFDGYYLYYPSRKQPPPAMTLLIEKLRYRGN